MLGWVLASGGLDSRGGGYDDQQDRHDPRIDPRIKAMFGSMRLPSPGVMRRAASSSLSEAGSEEAVDARKMFAEFARRCDTEEIAPSGFGGDGVSVMSQPDGN